MREKPSGGVADDGAAFFEHDKAVAAANDARPPIGAAAANHVLEMIVRKNAAIGLQPRLAKCLGDRSGVGELCLCGS